MDRTTYDREKLRKIVSKRIEIFKKKPEAAVYRPSVVSRHIYGLYSETTVRSHTVKADYPEPAGGTDRAPNPIELLLAALGACIEGALYEFAVHEGIEITGMTINIDGELDLRGLFMV
ncbi:MAG: OsmC family peroxiredoxin, partial [Nitrospirae bacterium]